MAEKKEIRRLRKEFEKMIKQVGIDNLTDPELLAKEKELEELVYEAQREYRQMYQKSKV